MRASSVFVFVLLSCAVGCGAGQSDPTEVDDESAGDVDTSTDALAKTSTPGKAVWTKIYRRTYREGEGTTVAGTHVASDENGHAYVTRAEQMFIGNTDAWRRHDVTKYDAYGTLKWRAPTYWPATAVAAGHGLVAVGETRTNEQTNAIESRLEVYDAETGSIQWSRHFVGGKHFAITAVAVDGSGNVAMTGSVEGAGDLGGGALRTPSGTDDERDAFVAKYEANGVLIWGKRFGSGRSSSADALAVDGTGDVYIGGRFYDSLDAGDGRVLVDSAGGYAPLDGFVARLTSGGAVEMLKQIGGTSSQEVSHIGVDSARNIIVGGAFRQTADFGGAAVNSDDGGTATSSREHFVAKLSPAGAHVWSRAFQGNYSRELAGLAVDSYNQVIVALNFDSRIRFGDKSYFAETQGHALVVKLSPANSIVWSKEYGTDEGSVWVRGLAVTPNARLLMTGAFFGRVTFGGSTTWESSYPKGNYDLGPTDGFLARLYQ